MHCFRRAAVIAAISLAWPRAGLSGERTLTLDQALALARERAPAVLSARARVDEARGRLVAASVLLRENPVIESGAGLRRSDRGDFVEADVGLTQTLELGGRRGARIDAAEADVAHAGAGSEDATQRLLRDVAVAFYRVLYTDERLRLATTAEGLASETLRIAERRHAAGDVPILDVNVARTALARACSDMRAAEALRDAALGELRILLGLGAEETVTVRGDLGDRRRFELNELIGRALDRPNLRTLDAEIREAQAEERLGGAMRWPNLGLGVRYEREEGADVGLGTLTLTLPVFEHGQGLRAEATARARRLRLELEADRRVVSVEVRTAFDVYGRRVDAALELERNAVPLLDENEALARRSYETGALGLAELLLVRREGLDTRKEYLERLLEAAIAGVELEASAGVLR